MNETEVSAAFPGAFTVNPTPFSVSRFVAARPSVAVPFRIWTITPRTRALGVGLTLVPPVGEELGLGEEAARGPGPMPSVAFVGKAFLSSTTARTTAATTMMILSVDVARLNQKLLFAGVSCLPSDLRFRPGPFPAESSGK